MIRVGIIGAGGFAARHAEALGHVTGVQLHAACRRDGARLRQFTDRFGVRGYTDHRELLADPSVDAVLVATPHHQHTDVVIDAARAGKHILLEKPMAPTLAECDRIIDAAAGAGVKLMIGHVFRFVRPYRVVHDLLQKGAVGELVYGVGTMEKNWNYASRRPWHLDRALGGGVMLTAGMHTLDVLTWLVGSRVTSVSAGYATRFYAQSGDDTSMLFLRYANGVVASVINTGYRSGVEAMHVIKLTCTEGMLTADPAAGALIGRAEKWEPVPGSASTTWLADGVAEEWRAFAHAIAAGEAPPVTGDDGRHILATMVAAEESSRLQREVAVS